MAKNFPRDQKVHQALGYLVEAHDGGRNPHYYWGGDAVPGVHCPACRSPIDYEAVSRTLKIRGRADAYWADGHIIVSERFRNFCRDSGYDDIEFPRVDEKRRLYEMRPTRVLQVDIERSEPLLSDFCTKCGNFECYMRGRGIYLHDVTRPLRDGVYRTDLIKGCRMGKSYDIIVAPETRTRMMAQGFQKLRFRALPDFDPDFDRRKARSIESDARWRKKERALERLNRIRARKGLPPGELITKLFRA
jgi:hypothetical protein